MISADVAVGNVPLSAHVVNSTLVINGSDTPDVIVGGLNAEASDQFGSGDTSVEITLTIEKKSSETAENADEVLTAIGATGKLTGILLDITITKTTDGTLDNSYNETANLIQIIIPLPSELRNKRTYSVFRYHNGSVVEITATANNEGEYLTVNAAKTQITIFVQKFSTYAIAYTNYDSINYYTFTVSAGAGGTISPASVIAAQGCNVAFVCHFDSYNTYNQLTNMGGFGYSDYIDIELLILNVSRR